MRRIFLRAQRVVTSGRKIGQRRRKLLVERIAVANVPLGRQRDLFLEQGVQDDRRATCILEALDGVEVVPEG